MTRQKLFVIASIITCYLLQAQGADKYTDENRPYEFGFTIDGQQHRHEEKDKNGIIKGEYGFITADGVYHVTVYATDEQGRFKILSMKNIRYRDYKGLSGPPSAPRQGHSLQLPSPQPATSQKPTSLLAPAPKPALEFETISIEPPANSCSHCSIPTTSTAAPRPIPPINQLNYANSAPNTPGQSNPFYSSNTPNTPPSFNSFLQAPNPVQKTSGLSQNQNSYNENQGFGVAQEQQNYNAAQSGPQGPISSGNPLGYGGVPSTAQGPKASGQQITPGSEIVSNGQQVAPVGQQLSPGGQQYAPVGQQLSPGGQQFAPGGQQIAPVGQQLSPGGQQFTPSAQQVTSGRPQNTPGGQQYPRGGDNFERTRSGKQYTGSPNLSTPQNSVPGGPSISQANLKPNQKPMLAYAQMQIVDKNTDIHAKRQGEKDGLPPGLKEDDMLKLLYTFNYTLGFQAHFEEGYTNGEKRGYYYTTGRNGVRTRIDYVADENGFRPTLSQEVYDTLSDEVPKEETEKEDKYGLKGYEFKWLYFPPGTNSQ